MIGLVRDMLKQEEQYRLKMKAIKIKYPIIKDKK